MINYESSFLLVKQHSMFTFYIIRYSKLPPPFVSKFLMLLLICVRKNLYIVDIFIDVIRYISPIRHHSKRSIIDIKIKTFIYTERINHGMRIHSNVQSSSEYSSSKYQTTNMNKICYVNTSMIDIPHVLP